MSKESKLDWKKYLTDDERDKMLNLEYELRMIKNRCIERQKLREKDDA